MNTWYEKAVFYHMYPLGMTGAPKTNHEEKVTDRFEELDLWIPHIQSLGCTAVYIGPLFESSSHGYDTKDYRMVDRRLGDNDSFKKFVTLCHESGIKVVVDGVFNHTGREFFAFRDIQEKKWDSPYKDWYKGVNFDWGSPMGDPFGYEAWQGHYELATLNLWNPAVKQYLFDTVRFWVDEFDIDGIRLDCANILDFGFMSELRHATEAMKADFWLMGEVIHGEYSRWLGPDMLHSVTNYELHKSLYSGFNDHNFFEIAHNVRRLEAIHRKLYTFVDNHDEDRIASKLNVKAQLFPVYACLFTLPGIPSIYYGGEWGVEGKRTRDSDEALRPRLTADEDKTLHSDLTDWITSLVHIHENNEEYDDGLYQELLLTNRQYAFARKAQKSVAITAANNDDNEVTLQVPVPMNGRTGEILLDSRCLKKADSATTAAGEQPAAPVRIPVENGKITVTIPGNSAVIVKIREE